MEPILDSSFPENRKFDAVMGARKGGIPFFALISLCFASLSAR